MINDTTALERERAKAIAEAYRHEGYEVVEQPSEQQLPPFLSGYQPDLLIRKHDETVVVEVKTRASLAQQPYLSEMGELLRERPGWSFELVMVGQGERLRVPDSARPLAKKDILGRAAEAERLLEFGFSEAALVVAWSASEAIIRLMSEEQGVLLERPDLLYLLKLAATNGLISRDDYHFLSKVSEYRNALVHGYKILDFDDTIIRAVITTNQRLLESS